MTAVAHDASQTEVATLPAIDFKPLISDFRAVLWCREHIGETDDARLGAKFMAIHQYFVRTIGRDRPDLFKGVDRAFLLHVVRQWMKLYLRTVQEVRSRYPRTDVSADLVAVGVNWSEALGIAYEGLDRLDIASRYAEFWAERAVTWAQTQARGEGVYESFEQRVAFVGTPTYVAIDEIKRAKQFQFLDAAGNGITSFDIARIIATIANEAELRADFDRRGWHVQWLNSGALDQLIAVCR